MLLALPAAAQHTNADEAWMEKWRASPCRLIRGEFADPLGCEARVKKIEEWCRRRLRTASGPSFDSCVARTMVVD
jgi:hypothetical protein